MKIERICVFIEYKKDISWTRDTKREIFKEGNIIWESYDVVNFQFGEDYNHKWDEIMIVDYPDEKKYNQALVDLKEESKVECYHVYLFEPYLLILLPELPQMKYTLKVPKPMK